MTPLHKKHRWRTALETIGAAVLLTVVVLARKTDDDHYRSCDITNAHA